MICQRLGTACTFNDAPRKRLGTHAILHAPTTVPRHGVYEQALNASNVAQVEACEFSTAGDATPEDDPNDQTMSMEHTLCSDKYSTSLDQTGSEAILTGSAASQDQFWHVAPPFLDSNFGLLAPTALDLMGWDQGLDTQWTTAASTNNTAPSAQPASTVPRHGRFNQSLGNNTDQSKHSSLRGLENAEQSRYSVLSGETDPYLLKCMRFSEELTYDCGQFAYRTMTAAQHSPVHFMISCTPTKDASNQEKDMLLLETLVPIETGVRLVGLYVSLYEIPQFKPQ